MPGGTRGPTPGLGAAKGGPRLDMVCPLVPIFDSPPDSGYFWPNPRQKTGPSRLNVPLRVTLG